MDNKSDELLELNRKLKEELNKLKVKEKEDAEKLSKAKLNCLQFSHLFDNSVAGLILLSNDFRIVNCNISCVKMLQIKKTDFIDKPIYNFLHSDSKKELNKWQEEKNKIKEKNITVQLRTGNNSYIWTNMKLSLLYDNEFNINHTFCQFQNISELKETQEKYSDQFNLLSTLINTVPDNVFAKDKKSRFILANNWVASSMGCKSPDELIGKTDFDFYPEKLAQKYYDDEQEVIQSGKPKLNIIERVLVKEKDLKWYSTSKVPLRNNEGEVIGIMGIGRDITYSVTEKKALKRAKKIAEKADHLKSAFLANMSHEIRTPLNGIIGFSQFLKQASLEESKREKYLDIILFNGKQLLHLINDIIDISKIDSGQISISEKSFSLNHLMLQLKQTFLGELSHKNKDNIELKVELGLDDPKAIIKTDDFRLKQILINLLSNAVKFTNTGSIEFGYKLENSEMLSFYVKDTGIGIPKNKIDVVFERFRQADGSLTRRYGGTGLGLSISKGLIELLGGEIFVDTEVNKGTTFSFTIPYNQMDSIDEPEKRRKKNYPEILKNKKILVIEDDEDSCKYLESILKLYNMHIIFCRSALKAIEIIENESEEIDLILMDIRLPVMNGYEATKKIKTINKSIPVIAQTAYAFEDDKEKCLKAGCDDYLTKPVDADLLIEKIHKQLKQNTNE